MLCFTSLPSFFLSSPSIWISVLVSAAIALQRRLTSLAISLQCRFNKAPMTAIHSAPWGTSSAGACCSSSGRPSRAASTCP